MNDIYSELFSNTWEPVINLGDILKVPLILLLVGTLLYSFMLLLKVKILVDTIDSGGNAKMKAMAYSNLLICILGTIIATVIILLG